MAFQDKHLTSGEGSISRSSDYWTTVPIKLDISCPKQVDGSCSPASARQLHADLLCYMLNFRKYSSPTSSHSGKKKVSHKNVVVWVCEQAMWAKSVIGLYDPHIYKTILVAPFNKQKILFFITFSAFCMCKNHYSHCFVKSQTQDAWESLFCYHCLS